MLIVAVSHAAPSVPLIVAPPLPPSPGFQGDVSGLMDKIQDVIPEDKQPELLDSIQKVGDARHLHSCGWGSWMQK